MCLAVPGRIAAVTGRGPLDRMARIAIAGSFRDASLAMLPDAGPGDWVLIQSGFAVTLLSPDEAERSLAALTELARHEAEGAAG